MGIAKSPPLGIAHFTAIEVPPLDLVTVAARSGFASIGLRLHPAFPGAPFYELPAGSSASREMRHRLEGEGIGVHDIEFVVIAENFLATALTPIFEAAAALGAKRLSVCGDDPDRPRLIDSFAALCNLAARFGMGVDLECMAWRRVASLSDAAQVVRAAGQSNGGLLIDALHLSRTGGSPGDVRDMPRGLIRSAQLCDAPAIRPTSTEAIIREARGGRLPPGEGELPLLDLLSALPADTVLSVEVPMDNAGPAEARLPRIYQATQRLFETGCSR